MKSQIKTYKKDLEIRISEIKSNHEELLKNFELCQQGKCDCPSDEYKKLEQLKIKSADDEIIINLKAKQKQFFNIENVKKCVNYILTKVSDK